MRHLSEGSLRRIQDDPYAIEEISRQHLATCTRCQSQLRQVAADARRAQFSLDVGQAPIDVGAAYQRLIRGGLPGRVRSFPTWRGIGRRAWRRSLPAAALALGLTALVAFTPLASGLRLLVQPQEVDPLALSASDMYSLRVFSAYGRAAWPQRPQLTPVPSASLAASSAGLPVLSPPSTSLPAQFASQQPAYQTISPATATFTFDAARARAAAEKAGFSPPDIGPKVDGSTLMVRSGPGLALVYGDLSKLRQARGGDPASELAEVGPVLVMGEIKAPSLSSTGVSLADLQRTLLQQPGLSDQIQNAIKALSDPTAVMFVPVPATLASAHQVQIHGAHGTEIGDSTNLGAAVTWIKDGRLYFVAGTVSEDNALAIANGL
jgi:hypothetical protein